METSYFTLFIIFFGFLYFIGKVFKWISIDQFLISIILTIFVFFIDFYFHLGYITKPQLNKIENAELLSIKRHKDNIIFDYIDEYGLKNTISLINFNDYDNFEIKKGNKAEVSFELYNFLSPIDYVDVEDSEIYITLPKNVKIPDLKNKKEQFNFDKNNDFNFKHVNTYNCYSDVELHNGTYVFSDKSNNVKFEYKLNPSIDIQRDSNSKDKVCLKINIYQNEKGFIYDKDHLNNEQILIIPADFDDSNLYIREEG